MARRILAWLGSHWPAVSGWIKRAWQHEGFRTLAGALLLAAMLFFGLAAFVFGADAAQPSPPAKVAVVIPAHSVRYRLAIEREAGGVFGLAASPARIAAQIHQESLFKADAASPYAQGLAQFTPATAAWMAKVFPRTCGEADPWDDQWAIRCAVRYDAYLLSKVDGATECDRWAFALSAYNGGLGWVSRDKALALAAGADAAVWFRQVELHTKRSARAKTENRAYVLRILLMLEPAYIDAGWPGSAACARGA